MPATHAVDAKNVLRGMCGMRGTRTGRPARGTHAMHAMRALPLKLSHDHTERTLLRNSPPWAGGADPPGGGRNGTARKHADAPSPRRPTFLFGPLKQLKMFSALSTNHRC